MLYVGLDLSRKRLDWQALDREGAVAGVGAVPPDRDGLAGLAQRLGDATPVLAVIESMTGARFVHDQLELAGWEVRIADAVKARGIGQINAYGLQPNGKFEHRGELRGTDGNALAIDGLWSLQFGKGAANNGPLDTLFFTAGPNGEADGLFRTIRTG